MGRIRGKVAIASYGETPVNRERTRNITIEQYLAQAAKQALDSAGMSKSDLRDQGVGLLEPESVPPIWSMQIIQDLGLEPRVVIRSDHGGIGAAALLEEAGAVISAGVVDMVLCLGADAPLSYLLHGATSGGGGALRDYTKPFGMMGPNSQIAFVAQRYIHDYNVKPEQVGKVSVVQRNNAALNPIAYLRDRPLTMEDYLDSGRNPMVSDPIRLLDCCIPVNGGLAFLVTTVEKAKEITDIPVYPLGLGIAYNYLHGSRMRPDITYMGVVKASREALAEAGVKHKDFSFFQCYDDYTYAVLTQLEDSGFCEKGRAGRFLEATDVSLGGELPINTGGGQLSSGQCGMSGAFLPMVEAIRQLRGEGGKRQVKDAKLGFVSLIGAIGQYCASLTNTAACALGVEV